MKTTLSSPSQVAKGHLAILVSSIIFGINIPLSKMVMPIYLEAFALTFFRIIGGMLLFWLASLFIKKEVVPIKDIGKICGASIFGLLLNQLFFIKGLEYTSPIEASIVVTFTPILTMLLSALLLKEPITFKKVIGVFLGLAGAIYMILSRQNFDFKLFGNIGGLLLCFISGVSFAIYLTAFKKIICKYHPITFMKWSFLFGGIVSFPITFPYAQQIHFENWPVTAYLQVFYVVFGATFLAYLLVSSAQRRLRPTTLIVYNYTQPITATVLALIWGLDVFTWSKTIASLLIFAGVYIVTQSKSRAQMDAEKAQKQNSTPFCQK